MAVQPIMIEKEQVASLKFPKEEVLTDKEQIKERTSQLDKAIRLGNAHRRKVKITFQDNEAVKRVETTVWAVTDKTISLKAGVLIPIQRIIEIKMY